MLNFIKRLRENDMKTLACFIQAADYRDLYSNLKLVNHKFEDEYLVLEVADNHPDFKDREKDKLYYITDFTILGNENIECDFYMFMIEKFGDEWYNMATAHFKDINDSVRLETLVKAKEEINEILEDEPSTLCEE